MKVIKVLLALVIAGSLAVTGVSLVKVIGVQRVMGEKQEALLGEVERQDEAVEAIIPAFQPTEEMVGKTEAMLADLQALAAVVSEMNGLVQAANGLQATTAGLLDMNNTSITRLAAGVSAADLPLAGVGERTALTLGYITQTLSALQDMAAGLRLSNSYAADLANMMEGKFGK
ncbi:MAG: hypothetical protein PHP28_13550 [Actinomycetota bacterium]|nr:hypothetical protein [Actinomycetota bacterium]MDD5667861.1 hypothetical protein [Actinomycetota bacterium]